MSDPSEAELRARVVPEFAAVGLEVLDVVRLGQRARDVDVVIVVFTAWGPSGSHTAHLDVRRAGGPPVVAWTSLHGVVGVGSPHPTGAPRVRALAVPAREARDASVVLSGGEARLLVALRDAIGEREGTYGSVVEAAGANASVTYEVISTVLDFSERRPSVESVLRVAAAVASGAPLEWALRRYDGGRS